MCMMEAPDPPRPRGGYHQRAKQAARARRAAGAEEAHSALVQYLLLQWSWGVLSGPQVQQIAKKAKLDMESGSGRATADINRMAAFGTGGDHPGNIHRQMVASLRPAQLPELFAVDLPMKDSSARGWHMEAQSMLLPHELFASLFHCYRAAWDDCIVPGAEAIRDFWTAVAGTAQFADLPPPRKPEDSGHPHQHPRRRSPHGRGGQILEQEHGLVVVEQHVGRWLN